MDIIPIIMNILRKYGLIWYSKWDPGIPIDQDSHH